MNRLYFNLFFILFVVTLFSSELCAENGVVRQYRQETGFSNSFMMVTEYENGNSLVVTYSICPQCRGTKKCGACYGQGGVYIGSITGYMPCIACGRSGVCGACDSNGLTILGSMCLDSYGNIVSSSSIYENSSDSRSSDHNSSKRSTCRFCNGTGYFIEQSSYPGTLVGNTPLYNSAGNKCSLCGCYNKHWHLECKH